MKNIKDILKQIKEGTSVEEIILMLKNNGFGTTTEKPVIKSEEDYAEMLEDNFRLNSDEYNDLDEPFWAYENFYPNNEYGNKDVGDGAWIKVKSDIGYNVYWAKRTKKQFNKTNIQRKIEKQGKQADKLLVVAGKTIDYKKAMEIIEKGSSKIEGNKELVTELMRAEMLEQMDLQPYCVKYRVSKSKWNVVMPCDYEIVDDIERYVTTIGSMGKTEAVTYKTIFTSVDNSVVFYLQSRGISRDMAVMMSKLKDCYFICNVPKMFEMCYQPVELVEAES